MKVLISGGTGLIGERLTGKLSARGYEVAILSRSAAKEGSATYYWDPKGNRIDSEAVNSCEYIIHLAGLNIGGGRWTPRRKKEILNSRVKSAELLFDALDRRKNKLKAFISASAIGYYGAVTENKIFTESDPPGNDFLGNTCKIWESVCEPFSALGIRTARIRVGIVLSEKAGALKRISQPIKLGLGAALGSGKQYLPWIHLDDLCEIFVMAIENDKMEGAYNAVAPQHVNNKEFTEKVAQSLHKPLWLPNIPSFGLKMIFGELADTILYGSRISSNKIVSSGYKFRYPTLEESLNEIYG